MCKGALCAHVMHGATLSGLHHPELWSSIDTSILNLTATRKMSVGGSSAAAGLLSKLGGGGGGLGGMGGLNVRGGGGGGLSRMFQQKLKGSSDGGKTLCIRYSP